MPARIAILRLQTIPSRSGRVPNGTSLPSSAEPAAPNSPSHNTSSAALAVPPAKLASTPLVATTIISILKRCLCNRARTKINQSATAGCWRVGRNTGLKQRVARVPHLRAIRINFDYQRDGAVRRNIELLGLEAPPTGFARRAGKAGKPEAEPDRRTLPRNVSFRAPNPLAAGLRGTDESADTCSRAALHRDRARWNCLCARQPINSLKQDAPEARGQRLPAGSVIVGENARV